MAIVLLLARLLLAVVFLFAGLAKLADLPGSRRALHDFGVPEALARPLGLILPIVEVALAIVLISRTRAWWAASGAFGLLLVFIVGISYNLARGRRPDCHCFGLLHSAPVGPSTLVRNTLLALVAALVAWFGHGGISLSATSWFTVLPLAQQVIFIVTIIALALIAGEGRLLLHMLRQQGRLLLRIERGESRLMQAGMMIEMPEQEQPTTGLPIGTRAPTFSSSGLDQVPISLGALQALGKPIVLIFSNSTCASCMALMPEVGRWQRDYAEMLTLVVLSQGSVQENRAKASEHHLTHLLLQDDTKIDTLYGVERTPSAVLIYSDGLIESPLAVGTESIRTLVAKAAKLAAWRRQLPLMLPSNIQSLATEPAVPSIGTPAPAFRLSDLNGKPVSWHSFLGDPTLLLFWNPGCVFCKRMLPDVKAWEAHPRQGELQLLIISEGTREENCALGLRSSVLLDEDNAVKMQFGATGTPMAILVDAQGRIASALAKGAPDVIALASLARDATPSSRVG